MNPISDVVVLLPGILGSVLTRNGTDVWSITPGAALRAILSLGDSVESLALTRDPPDVDDLGDGVTATRLISDVHLIPGLWKVDGYTKIVATLTQEFALQPGQLIQFPYDWRRDNRVGARQLASKSAGWLADWRQRSGKPDAKLILVGHSMGGLVARYFLEVLGGWKDTRMLVTFGTPYRGSLNALNALANGIRLQVGPLKLLDLTPLVTSLTSVYQLLPIYPCYDGGDGTLKRCADQTAAIPNLDWQKAADALAFHNEIRAAVDRNMADEAYRNNRYAIHPIAGIEQPTQQGGRLKDGTVEMLNSLGGRDLGGDGTVPRVSATPIELDNQGREIFAPDRHASLQNGDLALLNVKGLLSGLDIDQDRYRFGMAPGGATIALGLDLDDAYTTGEPVTFRVRPGEDWVDLSATVWSTADGSVVAQAPLVPDGNGRRRASVGPLPAGVYRVTVAGPPEASPVTDVFAVLGD
jgi:pimeloyl-ACP methyl ester carboxylesterase